MKPNEDTLDPITNDDSLADVPREDVDPVPDRVPANVKPKRKRTRKPVQTQLHPQDGAR